MSAWICDGTLFSISVKDNELMKSVIPLYEVCLGKDKSESEVSVTSKSIKYISI